jgi:hypothetical protein
VPNKTNTELIRELFADLALLKERLENVRGETGGLREMATQLALLQQRVDDMREGWKTWAQRLWMLLAPIIGVLIGYYLNRK